MTSLFYNHKFVHFDPFTHSPPTPHWPLATTKLFSASMSFIFSCFVLCDLNPTYK